jgi:hypothetical protein
MKLVSDEDLRDELAAHQMTAMKLPPRQVDIATAMIDAFGCFKSTESDEMGVVPVYQSFVCVSEEVTTLYCIEYGPLTPGRDTIIVDSDEYLKHYGDTWVGRRIAMVMDRLERMRVPFTLHKLKESDHSYCIVNRTSLKTKDNQDNELGNHFLFRRIICTIE